MWAFPLLVLFLGKIKKSCFFLQNLVEILWLPRRPSPLFFPRCLKKVERWRYITCNLFIWEVLHVYHKRGLLRRGNRACFYWLRVTSRDTRRLSARLQLDARVCNMTLSSPLDVVFTIECALISAAANPCAVPCVLYSLDLFLFLFSSFPQGKTRRGLFHLNWWFCYVTAVAVDADRVLTLERDRLRNSRPCPFTRYTFTTLSLSLFSGRLVWLWLCWALGVVKVDEKKRIKRL